MDKLVAIKIRQGTEYRYVPIYALAEHVEWDGQTSINSTVINIKDIIGNIKYIEEDGQRTAVDSIQNQLNRLAENKANIVDLQNYVKSQMSNEIASWLRSNIDLPRGQAILVDSSLSVPTQAAEAKVTGDRIRNLESSVGTVKVDSTGNKISLQSQVDEKTTLQAVQDFVEDGMSSQITNWLNENIHLPPETGILVDSSLSIEGQAAEAKTVGEKLDELEDKINIFQIPASESNIGESLNVKNVADGMVSEWELDYPISKNGFGWNLLNNTKNLSNDDIKCWSFAPLNPTHTMQNGILSIYSQSRQSGTGGQGVIYKTNVLYGQNLSGNYVFSFEMRNIPTPTHENQDNLFNKLSVTCGYQGDLSDNNIIRLTPKFSSQLDKYTRTIQMSNDHNMDWQKYYISFNFLDDFINGSDEYLSYNSALKFQFSLSLLPTSSFQYYYSMQLRNFKLEKGTVSSEWTPSVNDLKLIPEKEYTHIKYSNDGGETFTSNDGDNPGSWVGFYSDTDETNNNLNPTDYQWISVEGDPNGDSRGFTWNLLKESDINISTPHPDMIYQYQQNGWWKILGEPQYYTGAPNAYYVSFYSNSDGIIKEDSGKYCLSIEKKGNLGNFLYSHIYCRVINKNTGNSTVRSSSQKIIFDAAQQKIVEVGHYYQAINNSSYECDAHVRLMLASGQSYLSWSPNPEDLYACRVTLSTESYVFTGEEKTIESSVLAYKNDKLISTKIGTITGVPSGMTVTVLNNNTTSSKIQIKVSSLTTSDGVLSIPVTAHYKNYVLTFAYTVAPTADNVFYCTCDSSQTTTVKNVVCPNSISKLVKGTFFYVKFNNKSTATNSVSLKINNLTQKTVINNGETGVTSLSRFRWAAGTTILFVYDGNYFIPVNYPKYYQVDCSTESDNIAKTCQISNFVLCQGTKVTIRFLNSNTQNNPTLNISETGPISIYANNNKLAGENAHWNEDSVLSFTYSGTSWKLDNDFLFNKIKQKSKIFYSNNEPDNSGRDFGNGDTWFNLRNDNQINRFAASGQWQPILLGSNAIAEKSITSQHINDVDGDSISGVITKKFLNNQRDKYNYLDIDNWLYASGAYHNQDNEEILDNGLEIKQGQLSFITQNKFQLSTDHNQNIKVKYSKVKIDDGIITLTTPYNNASYPYVIESNNNYEVPTSSINISYNSDTNYLASPVLFINTNESDTISIGNNTATPLVSITNTDSIINTTLTVQNKLFLNGNIECYGPVSAGVNAVYMDYHIPRLDGSSLSVDDFDARIIGKYENRTANSNYNRTYQNFSAPQLDIQIRATNDNKHNGHFVFQQGGIEIYPATKGVTTTPTGGYIDFHYNGSYNENSTGTANERMVNSQNLIEDYTARIRESARNVLTISVNELNISKVSSNDSSAGNLNVPHFVNCAKVNESSDERLKKDITNIDNQYLSLLDKLKPKQFRFKNDDKKLNIGFVAQDVLKTIDQLGIKDQSFVTKTKSEDGNEYYSISYTNFIPILVKKCQQQDKKINLLEQKISYLMNK